MASLASKFMISDKEKCNADGRAISDAETALIFSTSIDLTPLLLSFKKGAGHVSIVYLTEAKA